MEYNLHYQPSPSTTPNAKGGVGQIEAPEDQSCNLPFQYRDSAPTEYEMQLCDALTQIFTKGLDTLTEIIQNLNDMDVKMPNGQDWTEDSFESEITKLGY